MFLTASDAVEDKAEALSAGGDDYVTKPFSLDEIGARAKAILLLAGDGSPGNDLPLQDRNSNRP